MAVKLEKIYQDCTHPDTQIQTFALMSITRLSPQLVDAPDQIQRILARLKAMVNSQNPDVVFLARKAVNHLEANFKAFLGAAPAQAPAERPAAPIQPAASMPAEPIQPVTPTEAPVAPPAPAAPSPEPPAAPTAVGAAAAEPPQAPRPARPARDLAREEILDLLPTTDDKVYLASLIIALVQKGAPEDVPAVLPFLRHSDDRVRSNAVEVVQAHGTVEHVAHLEPLLEDRSNRVVGNACMALARFDQPTVGPKLLQMLKSSLISMRETAAYVLTTLDKDYVEPLLIHAAQDPYEGVRKRAVRSLGRFLTRDSVNALKNALNDMDIDVCEAASDALRQIKTALQARRAQEEALAQAEAQAKAQQTAPAAEEPAPAAEAVAHQQPAEPLPPPPPAPARPEARPAIEATARSLSEDQASEVEKAVHAPVEPAPEPAVDQSLSGQTGRDTVLRDLGMAVYGMCRANLVTNELLDGIFYEILRYQDFLRAYQTKLTQGEDDQIKAAVAKLEEKIRGSLVNLGRQAASLFESRAMTIPEKEKSAVMGLLDRLKRARRKTNPG